MYLSEEHIISKNHGSYKECDRLTFLSKNLYNRCLYLLRQHYFETNKLLNSSTLYYIVKTEIDYTSLPRKVSKLILNKIHTTFHSFIKSSIQYTKTPKKYTGKPKLPNYLHKKDGRFVLIYEKQSINKGNKLSQTNLQISTKKENIIEISITKKKTNKFVISVIYKKDIEDKNLDKNNILGIDTGLNNIATLTSNKIGYKPKIINGRKLKSINQYYNKMKSKLQSCLPNKKHSSNRMDDLTNKRNQKVKHELHRISNYIIKECILNNIGTIVIGKNDNWKQNIELGKRNNQNFVSIPISELINQLRYKCELNGIEFLITEESYTSKCSFIDNEEICKQEKYLGKRISRGLFRTAFGRIINSDVNGSLNIIRKVFPNMFNNIKGIEVLLDKPITVNL